MSVGIMEILKIISSSFVPTPYRIVAAMIFVRKHLTAGRVTLESSNLNFAIYKNCENLLSYRSISVRLVMSRMTSENI